MLFLMAKIRKTAQNWFLFNMYNILEWCYRYEKTGSYDPKNYLCA